MGRYKLSLFWKSLNFRGPAIESDDSFAEIHTSYGDQEMPRECAICGKRVQRGYQYTYRGLAKYKGGVGRKVTGKTKRKFRPNLQKVRAMVGKTVTRLRVCTRCIKAGKVRKPLRLSVYETAPKLAAVADATATTGTATTGTGAGTAGAAPQ